MFHFENIVVWDLTNLSYLCFIGDYLRKIFSISLRYCGFSLILLLRYLDVYFAYQMSKLHYQTIFQIKIWFSE